MMATAAGQQQALGFCQSGGPHDSTEGLDSCDDPPDFSIGGNEALGVQLAEGNMKGPLIGTDFSKAVEREIGAFADADPGGADEDQRIGGQIIDSA